MARFSVLSVALVCALAAALGTVPKSSETAELRESGAEGRVFPATARHPGDPGYTLLRLGQSHVKWGAPVAGTGAVVRYAFVTRPTERPGAANCAQLVPFASTMKRSSLTPAQFESEIRSAMTGWEAIANIRFEPADDEASANLLIGMQASARGIAYADVVRAAGSATAPSTGPVPIRQAAICFNPELAWENRFDGDTATPDVRYVAGHEIGHVLGLDHSWGANRLMDFKYRETVRTPQRDDAAGAIRLYGPRKDTARVAYQRDTGAPANGAIPATAR